MTDEEKDKYITTLENLLFARNETLAHIPPCPVHGEGCQSWYRAWIHESIYLRNIGALRVKGEEDAEESQPTTDQRE